MFHKSSLTNTLFTEKHGIRLFLVLKRSIKHFRLLLIADKRAVSAFQRYECVVILLGKFRRYHNFDFICLYGVNVYAMRRENLL